MASVMKALNEASHWVYDNLILLTQLLSDVLY